MTGRYKAYPTYKSSTFEWLGDIPKHWDVVYSKWLFSERKVKAQLTDEMLTASQKYGVIPQKVFMDLEQQKVVQVQKGHDILKQVKKNDFVISMRSFQGGIEFCDYDGAVSSAYVPLESRNNGYSTYFKYLFKSKPYIQALQATTNLVRDGQALRFTNFTQVRLPLPTESEAQCIGTFLHHETAKIDTLITKQEKLIELLKEKRQSVISHAVTKGLNPDAPMKDSGVEWLGDVPEHWENKRIKNCASLISEKATIENQMVVALENIEGFTGNYISSQSHYTGEDVAFIKGDILFGKLRPYLSKVFHCSTNGVAFGDLLTYRPMKDTHPLFLFYVMISSWFIDVVDSSTYGAKMPRASSDFVDKMYIAVPPLEEQIAIANSLKESLLALDELSNKANAAIELMKERKTALISAVVTGKIDVREWQENAQR
ncbi:restriction endonuclease subunit S [Vibrio parahaemolyticus]|nr:restriction endonuclease subunit S [Vibrio parahaemolyticus]